ncbi:MAG: tetratricopeptide repeat protein [Treponema sp.]|nr:tetratricopeptide repeat protein [Treponema sp.]
MKMNKQINIYVLVLSIFFILIIASCSSAPKNPGDIYNLRNQAEEGLKTSNKEAGQGNLERALTLLTGYKRQAILADDPSLIIRICLSRGNVLFSLGRTEEAFAEWDFALGEAEKFRDSELLSVSRIFYARGNLISGRVTAQTVLDEVNRESVNIKKDRLYIAFSWQVRGLALRSLGRYTEAENAVKRSLEIHEKDRYLENASYDWYIIASIRSLAGNTAGALQALETSITIDRRIENSWGLAASWRAVGDVYHKAGRNNEALEAYRRARAIFAAIGNEHEVAEIDNRINN